MNRELYSLRDFLNLTGDEIDTLIEGMDLNVPNDTDKHAYVYNNLGIIEGNEALEELVSKKVLAGKGSVKWFSFEYNDKLNKDVLIRKLSACKKECQEGRIDSQENRISAVFHSGCIYTLKFLLKDGTHREFLEDSYHMVADWKPVTVMLDVDNRWVEIRASGLLSDKAKRMLITSFFVDGLQNIQILKNYDFDITKFRDEINGWYFRFMAMPTKNMDLTKEDGIILGKIVKAIDQYFVDKDGNNLVNDLDALSTEMEDISLLDVFLAGLENVSMKITEESVDDITSQGLYGVLKDGLSEDNSYIKFKMDDDDITNTIRVGGKSNSITFVNSVTEDVIEYIRDKII